MDAIDGALISFVTAVLTALVTASITFIGYWRKARADLESEYSKRFNNKKWEIYTEFTRFLHKNIGEEQDSYENSSLSDSDLINLVSQIMLVGSDKVISAYRNWRVSANVKGIGDVATKQKLFLLIVEMRRDLGNKSTKLDFDDLLESLSSDSIL